MSVDEMTDVQVDDAPSVSRRHRPMTAVEAQELTNRIRTSVSAVWQLLRAAYTERAWALLGYEKWDRYCEAEFGDSRIPIPREDRESTVKSLRAAGLSLRAIESATGIGKSTVSKLSKPAGSTVQNGTVDHDREEPRILGLDGRRRRASRSSVTDLSDRRRPAEPEVVDGSVEELVDCQTCGDVHPPEVSLCPYLAKAAGEQFDNEPADFDPAVEPGGSVAGAPAQPAADANSASRPAGPVGLAGLRAVGLGVRMLSDLRTELVDMSQLTSAAGTSVSTLEANDQLVLPDGALVDVIRQYVRDLRAGLARVPALLTEWEAIADRLESINR